MQTSNSVKLKGILKMTLILCILTFSTFQLSIAESGGGDHLLKATKLQSMGEYEEAIKIYNEKIKYSPTTQLYYLRGVAKAESGFLQEAINDFDTAIDMFPRYGEAYNKRALAKWDMNDFIGAIEDNNKAVELLPTCAEAYYNRGLTRCKLTDEEGGLSDFNYALKLDPEYAFAYLSRGYLKMKMKNFSEAEADIDRSISIDPLNSVAYKYKAFVLFKMGETKNARKFARKAEKMRSKEKHIAQVSLLHTIILNKA